VTHDNMDNGKVFLAHGVPLNVSLHKEKMSLLITE